MQQIRRPPDIVTGEDVGEESDAGGNLGIPTARLRGLLRLYRTSCTNKQLSGLTTPPLIHILLLSTMQSVDKITFS